MAFDAAALLLQEARQSVSGTTPVCTLMLQRRSGSTAPPVRPHCPAWLGGFSGLHCGRSHRVLDGAAVGPLHSSTYHSLQGWEGLADSIVGVVTVFWMALLFTLLSSSACVLLQGWEGLADSIVGAVTVFWMALLSDRAFQMTPTNWHGNSVRCARLQGSGTFSFMHFATQERPPTGTATPSGASAHHLSAT